MNPINVCNMLGIRALFLSALFVASQAVAAPREITLARTEVRGKDVSMRLDLRLGFGDQPQALIEIELENHGTEPMALPPTGESMGFSFRLVDRHGDVILDETPGNFLEGAPELPGQNLLPGKVLRGDVDLAARKLVRVRACPWEIVARYQGIFDEKLAEEPYLDFYAVQKVGDQELVADRIRILLHPVAFRQAAAFDALHAGIQVWDPVNPIQPGQDFVPGTILVTFASHVSAEEATRVVESAGYAIDLDVKVFETIGIASIKVAEGSEDEAIAWFKRLRCVKDATKNFLARIM